MAKIAGDLWQFRPVQMAAKSIAAGTVVAVGLWAVSAGTRTLFGDRDTAAIQLLAENGLHGLHDYQLIDIFARMIPFRRFGPSAFDQMYISARLATQVRFAVYAKATVNASKSYAIRKAFQKVIEATRTFRAILERKLESAIEDFDEIAVDLNARVEQMCTDAVLDYNV